MEVPVLPGLASDGAVDLDTARRAARAWRAGGLVALPTETVYGLAADAEEPRAVARIYRAKGRPAGHPLIVHVAERAALRAWSSEPNPEAEALAQAFWPGPLTLVVRRGVRAGDHITGGQGTVAVRSPGHPVALACLQALGELTGDPARGVAAPSANRFGRVSPTSAADVVAELGDRLDPQRDLIVDAGPCRVGLESTIVDCTATDRGRPRPRVLRPGAISQAQIDAVLGHGGATTGGAPGPGRPTAGAVAPQVPGTLAAHYAPTAAVLIVAAGAPLPAPAVGEGTDRPGLLALVGVPTPRGWVRLAAPDDLVQYASDLYAALRRADALGLATVVAVLPAPGADPLAEAIADRLARAAHRPEQLSRSRRA